MLQNIVHGVLPSVFKTVIKKDVSFIWDSGNLQAAKPARSSYLLLAWCLSGKSDLSVHHSKGLIFIVCGISIQSPPLCDVRGLLSPHARTTHIHILETSLWYFGGRKKKKHWLHPPPRPRALEPTSNKTQDKGPLSAFILCLFVSFTLAECTKKNHCPKPAVTLTPEKAKPPTADSRPY